MRDRDTRHSFVICVSNEGYPASLERRKIYEAITDATARRHHLVRVIDESGEDYLYPKHYFTPIELPEGVEKALLKSL
jgi:hypothetical protein